MDLLDIGFYLQITRFFFFFTSFIPPLGITVLQSSVKFCVYFITVKRAILIFPCSLSLSLVGFSVEITYYIFFSLRLFFLSASQFLVSYQLFRFFDLLNENSLNLSLFSVIGFHVQNTYTFSLGSFSLSSSEFPGQFSDAFHFFFITGKGTAPPLVLFLSSKCFKSVC